MNKSFDYYKDQSLSQLLMTDCLAIILIIAKTIALVSDIFPFIILILNSFLLFNYTSGCLHYDRETGQRSTISIPWDHTTGRPVQPRKGLVFKMSHKL